MFKLWLEKEEKRETQIFYRIYAPPTHGYQIAKDKKECLAGMPGICVDTYWTPLWDSILIMLQKVVGNFMSFSRNTKKIHPDDWTVRIYQVDDAIMKDVPENWAWASTGEADVNEKVLASLDGNFEKIKIFGKEVLDLTNQEDLQDAMEFLSNEHSYSYSSNRSLSQSAYQEPTLMNPKFDPRRAMTVLYKGRKTFVNVWNQAKIVQLIDPIHNKVIAAAKNELEFNNLMKDIDCGDDENTWVYLAYVPKDLWG